MITVSDTVRAILDSGASYDYHISVQSWRGDELLAEDVPIASGSEDSDRTLSVPERVTLSIPKQDQGFDWTPTSDDHPLAACGQTLKISLGIGKGTDGVELFQRGEFLITQAVEQSKTVDVTCLGLLALIDEAKFVSPFQPVGTIAGTLRSLIEPAVTADLDSAPTDRAVPTSAVNWDSDRLGALGELLDAWAAEGRMNELGYLEVIPADIPTEAVRAFTNDAGGTVIEASGSSSRDGGFNIVVATGYSSDGGEVRGVAYVTGGPWSYNGGLANPLPVPFGYSSPLLTTNAQCSAAATTVLRRKMRQSVLRSFDITAVPDPTIQVGDCVAITTEHVTDLLCTVETINLPYKATGPMTMRVVSTT